VNYVLDHWVMDWYAVVLFVVPVLFYWRGHMFKIREATTIEERAGLEHRAIFMIVANALMVVGFFSPIAWWAMVYQWVHMIWHLDLMVAAAPFVVLADPWAEIRRGVPRRVDRVITVLYRSGSHVRPLRAAAKFFQAPWTAVVAFDSAMWIWHLPGPFDWAMRSFFRMDLMMISFFVSGVMMWYAVIDPNLNRYHEPALLKVGHMFLASMSCMVLAMFLGLSSGAWYMAYLPLMGKLRTLSLLADQQFAAGILWVFGAIPWFIAGFLVLRNWLRSEEAGDLRMTDYIKEKAIAKARVAGRPGPREVA